MRRETINPVRCTWCSTTMDHLCEPLAITSDGPMHRMCALEREVRDLRRELAERGIHPAISPTPGDVHSAQ
jgi:hypothetical protein